MLRVGLIFAPSLACWCLLSPGSARGDDVRVYEVGAAKVDITPNKPILLSGYASRGLVEIGEVEQSIWARAIAIGSDAEVPAVLITVDNCGVPLAIRQKVTAALQQDGIPAERVTISSTHTHAAPMLAGVLENLVIQEIPKPQHDRLKEYTESLTGQLIEAARQALKNRRPSQLSFATGQAGFANNRRTAGGPRDLDVPVLRAVDQQGKIHAIVLGYACHCTSLPGVSYISGDWAGYACDYLEEAYDEAVALTVIGCGADQNPNPRGTLEVTKQHGRVLAEEVKRVVNGEMASLSQPISCTYNEIFLDFAPHPPRSHWENLAGKEGIDGFHARQMLSLLDSGKNLPSQIVYPIQTWTFGDELGMVFLADEVVVDYSLRLKRELAGHQLWVAAYCNDERCYIPSERVLAEGGYEGGRAMVWYGWPGPFAPGLEDKIVAEVHRQLPDSYKVASQTSPAFEQALSRIDPARTGNTLPLAPQAAIAAMRTHDNLRVELVAAEPLVIDPVAIDWAADGSLWVAEMHDYPEGLDGKYAPGGRVKRLRDTDGDGEYDTATTFLDGLPFPTGVTAWGRGVLVCAAPDVIYAEDTDGDDVADLRKTLLTGFVTHNYQARVNSLSLGLDNWLYAATGIFGGVIQTFNGQTIDVSNRDFRFLPERGILEAVSGRTQQGRARDDFGNWFGCSNGDLLSHYPSTERYFRRNPLVKPPPAEVRLGDDTLFPPQGLVTFELTGQPGRATAACGLGIYRDVLLGEDYYGNTFTCEPVNQLVHRRVLTPRGATFQSGRAPSEKDREFLVSTDNWFRPVQVRTGPDGALYVVDMYRYVIEHPRWIPPAARNGLDLRAGDALGRIYRVVPKEQKRRAVPNLAALDTTALASALDSPNGTVRDLVQQLLVQRGDLAAVASLERLATASDNPAVRIQALRTLDGLKQLADERLLRALSDRHAMVRQQAVELAETRLNASPALQAAVLALVDDESPRVQLQLAYSLGEWDSPSAAAALATIASAHGDDPYIRSAVLTSATSAHLPVMLARVINQGSRPTGGNVLADELLSLALRQKSNPQFDQLVLQIAPPDPVAWSSWQLQALAEIIHSAKRANASLSNAAQQRLAAASQSAHDLLVDDDVPEERRIASVQLVAATMSPVDLDLLTRLLAPSQPPALQAAAITAFGRSREEAAMERMLSTWPSLSPASRQVLLDIAIGNEPGTRQLLAALESGIVRAAELDAARRQQLLTHQNPDVRQRASMSLQGATHADRERVIQHFRDSMPDGDAIRGQQAFAKTCSACHRLDGIGHAVGPDLAALTNRSLDALLIAILDPNRDVDQRYAGYTVVTTDGRSFHGILAAESSNAVTLKAQENKEHSILRADIEVLHGTGKSMMPEGIERDISPAALADLLAYLGVNAGIPYRYAGKYQPDSIYPDDPRHPKLTDGILGSERFNDGNWVGVRAGGGVRPSLVFDFGKPTEVTSITIVYGVNHVPGGIHAPDRVTVSHSDNGKEFDSDQTFMPFDDAPDGLGTYQIARRSGQISYAGRTSRYLRLDFVNDGEWTFLTEVAFNAPAQEAAAATSPSPSKGQTERSAAEQIMAFVGEVKVGTPDEYRKIPDIWRQAIAAGRRNDAAELLAILSISLPETDEPLRDWQAVVIGGGLINGLTQAGVWPHERITQLIAEHEPLQLRWKQALSASVKMADNEQVKPGTRYDALRMVAMLPWSECGNQLVRYLGKDVNAELQQGAVSGLGDVPDDEAAAALIAALPHLAQRNQTFAAEALLRTPERVSALLSAIASGQLSALIVPKDVRNKLLNHSDDAIRQQSRRLLP